MLSSATGEMLPGTCIQEREPFLKIQRRSDSPQRESQLHHRKRNFGLDAHNDGFGAAQARHVSEVAQRSHRERVHDVEYRDVDDHSLRPEPANTLRDLLTQFTEVSIRQRRLHRGNDVLALLENRDFHEWFLAVRLVGLNGDYAASSIITTFTPSKRSASSIPPCKSPTVVISLKSTPIVTRVCAIS